MSTPFGPIEPMTPEQPKKPRRDLFATVALHHLTTLAESPAEEPVLYLSGSSVLDVWAAAYVSPGRIVLSREQLLDATGGEPWDALDQDAREHILDVLQDDIEERIASITHGTGIHSPGGPAL